MRSSVLPRTSFMPLHQYVVRPAAESFTGTWIIVPAGLLFRIIGLPDRHDYNYGRY